MVVDDDVAVDHDQGGPQPADGGQHPGVGEGARAWAQVVNGAAHQVALPSVILHQSLLTTSTLDLSLYYLD